jgi:hypothetical protein
MSSKPEAEPPVIAAAARPPVKLRKFEAPAELAQKFGVQTQQEYHISGVVKTEDLRDLLDAFGLQERSEVAFPFQHMKKQHGEIWGMRIEPADVHVVNGRPLIGHSWTFMQHYPERVGAAL